MVTKEPSRESGEEGPVRTLDDLAALSGVSRATVSRVLNGGTVAEDTRRRVLDVVTRTNFRPNAAARTLASGRSGVVGVVMHIDPHLLFQDPYFSQLLQGITDYLAEQGAGMMLWLGNRTKEETLDHVLGMSFLDGVVVSANTLDDPVVDGLLSSSLSTVLIGHRRADRTASYVDIDNEQASDAITTHLISIGRTRVGHITGSRGTVAGEDRVIGYLRAMRRAGLNTDGLIADGDFNRSSGVAAAAELLDRGVDAIFCANDATAAGALEAIRRRSAPAASAFPTTSPSPVSTISSSRLTWIRPSPRCDREFGSRGPRLPGPCCSSWGIRAAPPEGCSCRRSWSFGNPAWEVCLANDCALTALQRRWRLSVPEEARRRN